MLTDLDMKALIDLKPKHPVLSVYLNMDPSSGSADAYRLHLRQMLKEFEEDAANDTEAILRFIQHEYDWSGRSLVIFSCVEDGLFRSFPLSLPQSPSW